MFGPEAKRGLWDALVKLWRVILRVFQLDVSELGGSLIDQFRSRFERLAGVVTVATVPAGLAGLVLFGFDRVREKLGKHTIHSIGLFRDSLVIAPIVYLGFCLINFQAGPDLIPLFPFIGVFAGLLLVSTGRFLDLDLRVKRKLSRVVELAPWLALALILTIIMVRTVTYRLEGWTLQHQDWQFGVISNLLGPDDKIYVHGTVEILVLLNRPNMTPYADLDWGKDDFAALRTGASFAAIVREMEAQSPKIVALSRLRAVSHRAELEQWVSEHYDQLEVSGYEGVYVRRP